MGLDLEFYAYPPQSRAYKLLLKNAHNTDPKWKQLNNEEAIEKYLDSFLPTITDEHNENYGPKGLDKICNLYEDFLLDCEDDSDTKIIARYRKTPNLNGQMEKQWRKKYNRLPYYEVNEDDPTDNFHDEYCADGELQRVPERLLSCFNSSRKNLKSPRRLESRSKGINVAWGTNRVHICKINYKVHANAVPRL